MEFVITSILILLAIYSIVVYNKLIRDKNTVLAGWSDIDVQLKRRHDLIPKLVEAVKQYAGYERSTLDAIVSLRTKSEQASRVSDKARYEKELNLSINNLIAVAEDYPDLKANESFQHLLENISDIESHIQYARRFYNGAVKNFNVRIDSFPDLVVARMFNFKKSDFFDFDA